MAVVLAYAACGGRGEWRQPNGDTHGTRAATGTAIDASNVARLRVAWRFRIPVAPGESGAATATPVVAHGVVYVQDMQSDVFALDVTTGALRWRRLLHAGNPGPNGLAVDGRSVFGSTDTTVFALDRSTGGVRWRTRILGRRESFVDIAPLAAGGLVYTATTGYFPGSRGAIYALDARTGRVRWRFDTIRGPWPHPAEAGGGGAWQTPTLSRGTLYVGTANPLPWGGSPRRPNGGAYRGRALYTDSLLALDAHTGALRWFDQVTPHDVRDHDFQNSPIVAGGLVVGSGKSGRIVAWDEKTHRRVWETPVGLHRNDERPLPRRSVSVCPGLLGGVETPAAAADGRVFAAVVDLCYAENATGSAATSFLHVSPARGRGRLVALDLRSGTVVWERRLARPPFACATVSRDVVFAPTYDGRLLAFAAEDGRTVWSTSARGGVNACPSVAGHRLFVAVGVTTRPELVAYAPS